MNEGQKLIIRSHEEEIKTLHTWLRNLLLGLKQATRDEKGSITFTKEMAAKWDYQLTEFLKIDTCESCEKHIYSGDDYVIDEGGIYFHENGVCNG